MKPWKGQKRAWERWRSDQEREAVLYRLQWEMAEKRGTLLHEERQAAIDTLWEYRTDPERETNRPLLHALVTGVRARYA